MHGLLWGRLQVRFPGMIFYLSTEICERQPGGLRRLIFAGYVPLVSQNPYPVIVYSVAK